MDIFEILEKKLPAPGNFTDCYAFSIHKSGSTLMHSMIQQACNASRIPAISIPDILFLEGIQDNEWCNNKHLIDIFIPGRVYFGFRYLPDILLHESIQLRNKKCVLLVRDPRDALVSQFYSFGGKHLSHRLPEKNREIILKKISTTADLEIDEYVLRSAALHLHKLQKYQLSLDFDHILLKRYEDIYFNKKKFINDIFMYFDIDVDSSVLDKVATDNDIRPIQEDPTKHIRKGTPGDHRLKLQQDTISKLNDIFRETCRWYGYNLD